MVGKGPHLHWTALSFLTAISFAFAHGHDEHSGTRSEMATPSLSLGTSATSASPSLATAAMSSLPAESQTYYTHSQGSSLLLAHIILMTIAWVFTLPIAVMLSITRSRLALLAQLAFFGLNGFGLLLATVYNSKAPDLYENNLHHKLGWAVTWVFLAQILLGLLKFYSDGPWLDEGSHEERAAFMPVSVDRMAAYQQLHPDSLPAMHRYSHDSGQGTEPDSTRSNSLSGLHEEKEGAQNYHGSETTENMNQLQHRKSLGLAVMDRIFSRTSAKVPKSVMKLLCLLYDFVDRLILVLGFVAILTGIVTYGGVFHGNNVFNGLAHAIKGGIFFWYGLLTLGRWMGSFADFGWAWNVRPPAGLVSARKAAVPSAEFVESFVIFLYGSTNVFLEHLAAWGDAWTAQDLEHVSISVMFFGGGLCGMLIESKRVRDLLNTSISGPSQFQQSGHLKDKWDPPKTYSFSMNPFPGLIILLLGLMMSSHHQHSVVSTMVHKQWGTLFVGFALARAVTYILTYISPPTSYFPSRPPSELVTSFCLIAGGIIFIASNKDTVAAMERHDINAMFIFTVTMGLTAFLMSWTIIVLAVKGWATKKSKMLFVPRQGGLL